MNTKEQIEWLSEFLDEWFDSDEEKLSALGEKYAKFVIEEDLPRLSADELMHQLIDKENGV